MNSVRKTVPIIFGILILTCLSGFQFAPMSVQTAEAEPSSIAGWRSSQYGDYTKWGHDQSDPVYWISVAQQMSSKFPGFSPGGVLVVGEIDGAPHTATSTLLPFPKPDGDYPNVTFSSTDSIEPLLDAYDNAGLKVYLQVEPADADIPMLMNLTMNRYGNHPSVIGFGVDVEWYHEKEYRGWGRALTDNEVNEWASQVKTIDPNYSLMVKHWDPTYLSNARPDNVLFLTDSQDFSSLSAATDEYILWIEHFGDAQVGFQIGYPADMSWWDDLDDPASEIMNSVISARPDANIGAIFWVDFSVLKAFPDSGINNPPEAYSQEVQLIGSSVAITLTGSDIDFNDNITFSIYSHPSDGRLSKITTINSTAVEVEYTPKRSYSETDFFSFIVNDETVNSLPATVTITQGSTSNTPPDVTASGPESVPENSQEVTLVGNATDEDGDPLSYQWVKISGPKVTLMYADQPSASFTAPSVGPKGKTIEFQLTVSDGISSSSATVRIDITNS